VFFVFFVFFVVNDVFAFSLLSFLSVFNGGKKGFLSPSKALEAVPRGVSRGLPLVPPQFPVLCMEVSKNYKHM